MLIVPTNASGIPSQTGGSRSRGNNQFAPLILMGGRRECYVLPIWRRVNSERTATYAMAEHLSNSGRLDRGNGWSALLSRTISRDAPHGLRLGDNSRMTYQTGKDGTAYWKSYPARPNSECCCRVIWAALKWRSKLRRAAG